jgi:hypothetical protein
VKVARVAATRPAAASGLLRQARFTSIGWRVGRSRHRKPALHPLSTRCSGAGAGEVTRRQGRRLGNAGGGEWKEPVGWDGSSRSCWTTTRRQPHARVSLAWASVRWVLDPGTAAAPWGWRSFYLFLLIIITKGGFVVCLLLCFFILKQSRVFWFF